MQAETQRFISGAINKHTYVRVECDTSVACRCVVAILRLQLRKCFDPVIITLTRYLHDQTVNEFELFAL